MIYAFNVIRKFHKKKKKILNISIEISKFLNISR